MDLVIKKCQSESFPIILNKDVDIIKEYLELQKKNGVEYYANFTINKMLYRLIIKKPIVWIKDDSRHFYKLRNGEIGYDDVDLPLKDYLNKEEIELSKLISYSIKSPLKNNDNVNITVVLQSRLNLNLYLQECERISISIGSKICLYIKNSFNDGNKLIDDLVNIIVGIDFVDHVYFYNFDNIHNNKSNDLVKFGNEHYKNYGKCYIVVLDYHEVNCYIGNDWNIGNEDDLSTNTFVYEIAKDFGFVNEVKTL